VANDDRYGITRVFGRQVLQSRRQQWNRWIDLAFEYWRARGFPYPQLTAAERLREFRRLSVLNPGDLIQRGMVQAATVGLRLANSFHPGLWEVPAGRHAKAPIDHFKDDQTLRKLLSRAPIFWPNRRCWNEQCVRSAVRIYGGGRVSNFRPAAARGIISRYSEAGSTVLDFSAGFGGRLLGCLTLRRRYLGIEPAAAQIKGLRQMANTLRGIGLSGVDLIRGCAEDEMPNLERGSVDLVFSSPPYFKVERYSSEATQSYQRYPTYEQWKDHFLFPVLAEAHRVLRPGGLLIINVADTRRHPIATDMIGMTSQLYRKIRVLRLLMHSRPEQRSFSTGSAYRWEPVFVLKRT
jgi:SAM-dependent methyltransferase